MDYDLPVFNAVHACTLCPLNETRVLGVPAQPGAGYQRGGLALMVDTARELDQGAPVSEVRAAKMLDRILLKAGTNRAEVLTIAKVRCAPPRGRVRDHEDALIMCDTHTRAELASYQPSVVALMGGVTIEAIYGKKATVAATHGKLAAKAAKHAWGERLYVATYHPSAALIDKSLEDVIVEDLRVAVSLA
ncbi:MAG: uracil-DNA glycosylase family protein [Planctomycetota bacterium]